MGAASRASRDAYRDREASKRRPCPRECDFPDEPEPIPDDAPLAARLALSGIEQCVACRRTRRLFKQNPDGTIVIARPPS